MKNKIKIACLALMTVFAFAACTPQEFDEYDLGTSTSVTADQMTFSYTTASTSNNVLIFSNTSQIKGIYSYTWDFGNGATGKTNPATAIYPDKGTYRVSLTIKTPDGNTITASQDIVIANDDPSLLDTPNYRNLTGGVDEAEGKVWVFDQNNLYVGEAAQGSGKAVTGHMGLGDFGSYGQGWWGAGPNNKEAWKLYDFKFTFTQNGLHLNIANEGLGYGRNALIGTAGFTATEVEDDDATFNYPGGDYTFSLDESGEYPKLTLSGNAFFGYYAGTQEYEIIYLTEEVLAVCAHNGVEGQDWVFVLIREDLNVSEPPVVKELREVPLSDDFEGSEPLIAWAYEDMGELTSPAYQNPAPVTVNLSAKVFLYQKTDAFYSNISYTTTDYLFDLKEQNKIKMKVYLPGYNDYVTGGEVAGDWITNNKLLRKVAVKLQDSSQGGNAWETQTEIVKTDLETDQWLELEFDFSEASAKKDYDRIVVQFGDEGHSRPGIFFFDDFEFTK